MSVIAKKKKKKKGSMLETKYNLKIPLSKAPSAHQCDTSLLFGRTQIEWMEKEHRKDVLERLDNKGM